MKNVRAGCTMNEIKCTVLHLGENIPMSFSKI